ncbi:MAG: ATP-binding protein [Candidatus Micrarchaeota archaeon]|nr:ATP-binding protein [Candidatus Micrarchaeota archaeon]
MEDLIRYSQRQLQLSIQKSERFALEKIKKLLPKHPCILIKGLRGSGKTTLLRSLHSQHSLMVSGDFLRIKNISWEDVYKTAEKMNAHYILIDEIHHLQDWKLSLKVLCDWAGKEKAIIATGSSALSLEKAGDIKRRSEVIPLGGLSYAEFLAHVGIKLPSNIPSSIYQALFASQNLEESYHRLWKILSQLPLDQIYKHFPSFKEQPLPALYEAVDREERMRAIIYSVIEEDIPTLVPKMEVRTLLKAKEILHYLAISEKISINKLANLSSLSKESVVKLLNLLEAGGILRRVPSGGKNVLKDQFKYLFTTPLMRRALSYGTTDPGFEREDLFAKIIASWNLPFSYHYPQSQRYDFKVGNLRFEIGDRSKRPPSHTITVLEGGPLSFSQGRLTIPLELLALMERV